MRSISRSAFVVLVAVFVLSALPSASASATLPEFSSSIRGTLGSPTKVVFLSGHTTLAFNGFQAECKKAKGVGSITGAKTGTATLTFEECSYLGFGKLCGQGIENGTIVTETVPFVLVYTEKEPAKQVAIDFNHTGGVQGGTLATFQCGSLKVVVRHSILAPVTPLNTVAKSFTATFSHSGESQTPFRNYTEALTGMEYSYPEVDSGNGFTNHFYVAEKMGVEPTERGGRKVEEGKIEA